MDTILCSIIIPTFDHEDVLFRSIESALAQTLKDVEIIVVDDGSTDGSEAKLRSYGDRIRYIRQENSGLGAARNTGIRASRGKYLQFLDADDRIEPEKIETQLRILEADASLDVVYSDCPMTGPNGESCGNASRRLDESDPLRTLATDNPFPVHAAIVRREPVVRAGMFDESRAIHEDWDLWLRLALQGSKFRYLPGEFARYHRDFSAISTNRDLMFRRSKSMLEKHFANPELKRAGRVYFKFVAFVYILLCAAARDLRCWKAGRQFLLRAAKADPRMLDLRLWLYFPESFVRQAIDWISGSSASVPASIGAALASPTEDG